MRAIRWLSVLPAAAVLLAGCADPSLEADADDLRSEVAGLPAVTAAELHYTEPVTLDTGKVVLRVRMDPDATTDEVVAAVAAAYDAFQATHHGEEADLALRAGRTTVALRSFEPDAEVTAVEDAVRTGLEAAPGGGSVAIDLTTQDVRHGDHVAGTYVVALPTGSTYAEVPDLLASLEAEQPANPLIGWGVAAADGSSLSYDAGFPPTALLNRWERIQQAGPRLTVRAVEDGAFFAAGRVATREDVRPQVRALGGGSWTYELTGPDGGLLASIDRYICEPTSEGAYDDRLEEWVESEVGACDVG